MAFFAAARQGRRDDAELGKGVWRRAHDRFRRGLDRFHQMLEGVAAEAAAANARPPAESGPPAGAGALAGDYDALVPIANDLAALLPVVRQLCIAAQREAPSAGMEIPPGDEGRLGDMHRELSRAGNALAAAAEAVAMVRLGAGDVAAVERRAALVRLHVVNAQRFRSDQDLPG